MDMTIPEGNKLIAEFMGATCETMDLPMSTIGRTIVPSGRIYFPNRNPENMHLCKLDELRYDKSWDWLMPVVEKANIVNNEMQRKVKRSDWDDGEDKDLDDPTGWRAWSYRCVRLSTDIVAVWNSVVDFIQWYNQNSKQWI